MFNEAKSQVEEVTSQVIKPEDIELLKDPLGTKKLNSTVTSLIEPLKNPSVVADEKKRQAEAPTASSIWSSLAQPAAPAQTNEPAAPQVGQPAEGETPATPSPAAPAVASDAAATATDQTSDLPNGEEA